MIIIIEHYKVTNTLYLILTTCRGPEDTDPDKK